MKHLIAAVLLVASHGAYAVVDYSCQRKCMAAGGNYQVCERWCTY